MKARIYISLSIIFLIIYFLQASFFQWFNLASVKPNLFIILVLFIGLFAGGKVALKFGIIFGIFIDLFIGRSVGITSVMLGIIGLFGGYLDKSFSKDSRLTLMLMVLVSTFVYETGVYIIKTIIMSTSIEVIHFLKILLKQQRQQVVQSMAWYHQKVMLQM